MTDPKPDVRGGSGQGAHAPGDQKRIECYLLGETAPFEVKLASGALIRVQAIFDGSALRNLVEALS